MATRWSLNIRTENTFFNKNNKIPLNFQEITILALNNVKAS